MFFLTLNYFFNQISVRKTLMYTICILNPIWSIIYNHLLSQPQLVHHLRPFTFQSYTSTMYDQVHHLRPEFHHLRLFINYGPAPAKSTIYNQIHHLRNELQHLRPNTSSVLNLRLRKIDLSS